MVKDPGRVPSSGVTELLLTRQASSFLLLEPRESRWERLCVCRWAEGRQKKSEPRAVPCGGAWGGHLGTITCPSPEPAGEVCWRPRSGSGEGDKGQGRGRPEDRIAPQTAKGPSEQVKGLDGDMGSESRQDILTQTESP